jgi:hypothetical protein
MAFVYEVNGQRVEFETEPSEADIDEAARSLGTPAKQADTTVPAVGAMIPGETGLKDLARTAVDVGKTTGTAALKAAVSGPIAAYAANPLKAGAIDVASTLATGLPLGSTYNAVKSLPAKYQAAREAIEGADAALSKTPGREFEQALAKGQMPEAPGAYRDLRAAATRLDPAFSAQMKQALDAGNDPAVKKLLEQAPDALKNDPKFAALAEKYAGAVPGFGTKAMRVAEPILRGVSKVAAPVGAALEGAQGVQQARQGDTTGATLSGLGAASMFNPVGMLAQPGLSMMQTANQNFRQQTPDQQRESAMDALSGMAPGMAGEYFAQERNDAAEQRARIKQMQVQQDKQVLKQPGSTQNYMERMRALSNLYSPIR